MKITAVKKPNNNLVQKELRKGTKENRDEERKLLEKFNRLQEQIRSSFNEAKKAEIDRVKSKLAKVVAKRTQLRNNSSK